MVHLLVKFGLIFFGGAAVAATVMTVLPKAGLLQITGDEVNGKVQSTTQDVQSRAEKKTQENTISVINSFGKVLSSITESPALGPLLKTKRDVEQTVNEVKNLPDEQRNAICKQICTQ